METAIIVVIAAVLGYLFGFIGGKNAIKLDEDEYKQAMEKRYKNSDGFLEAVKRK